VRLNGTCGIYNVYSGGALVVAGGSHSNGAHVCQWQYNGNLDQRWYFRPIDGDYHIIRNENSGKVLVVAGGSTANGARLCQWDESGNYDQQWLIELGKEERGGRERHVLTNRHSGKVMVVAGGSCDYGAEICQWDYSGRDDQLWDFYW
jgi:uncharacterized protein YodC (DUF2158 family)